MIKIVEEHIDYSKAEIAIQSAQYIGDFAIRISFDDKTEKLVDFKPFLENSAHPDIRKYLDEDLFKQFKIINGNLDWNDFEMCFPIRNLYENTVANTEITTL